MPLDDRERQERVARMAALLEAVESLPDTQARSTAEDTVRALVDLYGEGLARVVEYVFQLGGEEALRTLAEDELVAHLLLLHGLHPVEIEERVARALEEVRPFLRSHGGNVELLGIEAGIARLRLLGSCTGRASSAKALTLAIEEAIAKHAPDLLGIETEGKVPSRSGAGGGPGPQPVTFVPRSARLRGR